MKTRNMKADLIATIERLRGLDATNLDYALDDLIDELSGSRVTVRVAVPDPIGSPVPDYNADRDGDYSAFLVSNNID